VAKGVDFVASQANEAIRILLVEDEAAIREPLSEYLIAQGYAVTAVATASAARSELERSLRGLAPHIVVSDIMMPGEDGLSLTRHIRESCGLPVILLTARTEETERIIGLEVGADDYLGKPFSPRELVARIRAVLRRSGGSAEVGDGGRDYDFAGWTLKSSQRCLVDPQGINIPLSAAEFRLMDVLVRHPRQVMARDRLLDLTKGDDTESFDRAIDNQISRLRRKIEVDSRNPQLIKTVWGGGYSLAADVTRRTATGAASA
jgi:two-component system, OmpR family, response regulator